MEKRMVRRINVTPIKGTRITMAEKITLGSAGVRNNRRFFWVNRDGIMINGKRTDKLTTLIAMYRDEDESLDITFPDGRLISAVTTRSGEMVESNFYGRPVRGEFVEGPWAGAVSEYIGMDVRLVEVELGTTATDVHPITIISEATLDFIKNCSDAPELNWNDRFRMLFEIDGLDLYEEETWIGNRVALGNTVVEVVGPVPRCVVTSYDPIHGGRTFDTLRALRQARGVRKEELSTPTDHLPDGGAFLLGVYAVVIKGGVVEIGDEVGRLE